MLLCFVLLFVKQVPSGRLCQACAGHCDTNEKDKVPPALGPHCLLAKTAGYKQCLSYRSWPKRPKDFGNTVRGLLS